MSVAVVFAVVTWLGTLSILLPLWMGFRHRGSHSEARRFFLAYCVVELLIQVTMFAMSQVGIRNLWLAHLVIPVETALILRAFAAWQVDPRMRRALMIGAPLALLFWLPPLLGWEPINSFSIVIDSAQGILCVAVAAYTVVRRYFEDEGPITERDWFWISAGVMLYFATFALISPLTSYLLKHGPALAYAVYIVRGGLQVVANVLYYLGMKCPPSPSSFGPSTSPRPWWRLSWSWLSARR